MLAQNPSHCQDKKTEFHLSHMIRHTKSNTKVQGLHLQEWKHMKLDDKYFILQSNFPCLQHTSCVLLKATHSNQWWCPKELHLTWWLCSAWCTWCHAFFFLWYQFPLFTVKKFSWHKFRWIRFVVADLQFPPCHDLPGSTPLS